MDQAERITGWIREDVTVPDQRPPTDGTDKRGGSDQVVDHDVDVELLRILRVQPFGRPIIPASWAPRKLRAMRILHLADAGDWAAAKALGRYDISTRGATLADVGFIHCSTPDQVAGVVARFYSDEPEGLLLLELDDETVRGAGTEVRYEDPGNGQLFPHIYGPIDLAWVTASEPYRY